MEGMAEYPDNYFDLAIVDPPYYDGIQNKKATHSKNRMPSSWDYDNFENWEIPGYQYFNEIKRVSKKYVIWGCNYFEFGCETSGRIVWDKCNESNSYSDCEIAMTNCHDSVRKFTFMWNGMLQGKNFIEGNIMQGDKSKNEKRIHQNQKPVALYEWLFTNYSEEGFKVLDTHSGSASSFLAASKFPIEEFVAFELDENMFNKSVKRIKEETAQLSLF